MCGMENRLHPCTLQEMGSVADLALDVTIFELTRMVERNFGLKSPPSVLTTYRPYSMGEIPPISNQLRECEIHGFCQVREGWRIRRAGIHSQQLPGLGRFVSTVWVFVLRLTPSIHFANADSRSCRIVTIGMFLASLSIPSESFSIPLV